MGEDDAVGSLELSEGLVLAANRLLEIWADKPRVATNRHPIIDSRSATIVALAAHAHRLVDGALSLIVERRLVRESAPLVRGAFENAITAQWLYQYDEAALNAFLNESSRQSRNFLQAALENNWIDEVRAGALRNASLDSVAPTEIDDAGRIFHRRCLDLDGPGPVLYAYYRALSALTHPGSATVSFYADLSSTPPTITLSPNATNSERNLLLLLSAFACIWAGRIVDLNDQQHPNRENYRYWADKLNVRDVLQKSAEGKLRAKSRRRKS